MGWPRATARAGNVIGGGDWAPNRLLPDLVRAWTAGVAPSCGVRRACGRGSTCSSRCVAISCSPRRWRTGARCLPASISGLPTGNRSRSRSSRRSRPAHGGARRRLPEPAWTEAATAEFEETGELTLDSRLAAEQLGWRSVLDWQTAVTLTLEWYAGARTGESPAALVERQLAAYTEIVGSAA